MIIVEFRLLRMVSSHLIVLISKLFVGSSSNNISGSANNAWAKSTLNFKPGGTSLIGLL